MINNFLAHQIRDAFALCPTPGQERAIDALARFVTDGGKDAAFLLRGYAGTGKTSVVSALVKAFGRLNIKCVLLAPTGRAAKVFAAYAGHRAYTIHRKIYRQQSLLDESARFRLNDNLSRDTLFLVDEASMISNAGFSSSAFGSGRLLDDLVRFVYQGDGCRLILLGDSAQLPPVGEERSVALSAGVLGGYGLQVSEEELTQVVRQDDGGGVLWNATALRRLVSQGGAAGVPTIRIRGFADVRRVAGSELVETIERCYDRAGVDGTIVICRSNKQANLYNRGIRSQVLWREDELEPGDRLMVVKNNYFWVDQGQGSDFIANGETVVVERVRRLREMYGFRFADVTLVLQDHAGEELEMCVLLDTLHSDTPALSQAESERLFSSVLGDYEDVAGKKERVKRAKADIYCNALQVKYAYAVTCHKAQGGQWENVFLDQGYLPDDSATTDYYRWLYTAFTRTTGTLYLVNYPQDKIEGE